MKKLAQAILFGGSLALSGAVLADHEDNMQVSQSGDLSNQTEALSSVGNIAGSLAVQSGRYEQDERHVDNEEAHELNNDENADGTPNTDNDVAYNPNGTQVDGGVEISSGSAFDGSQLENGAVVFEPYWYGSSEDLKMEIGGEYGTRKGDEAGTVNAKGLLYGKADPLNVSLDGVIVEPVGLGLESEGSLLP